MIVIINLEHITDVVGHTGWAKLNGATHFSK